MKRMIKLYGVFISQHLKKLMEYKVDFLTGAVSFFINQAINIAFLFIIFSQIPDLMGWSFEQIIFIYGFSLLPKGLDHLFADNLWKVGYFIVRKGDFDKYLTRPINPLIHVLMEDFQVDAFGELLVGVLLMGSVWPELGLSLTILDMVFFVIAVLFATLIYTSIKILFSAFAFWIKRSGHIIHMFYMVNDFAKYPTTIYNDFVKSLITYIIPFAFTAFYPASYFLTKENPAFNIGGTVVVASLLFCVAYAVWCKGIRAYESAGS